jgi:hypothetical protein
MKYLLYEMAAEWLYGPWLVVPPMRMIGIPWPFSVPYLRSG